MLTQQFQGALGQGHVAVAVTFGGTNVQKHALAIDIAHLQADAFPQAQTARVDDAQQNPVHRQVGKPALHRNADIPVCG